MRKRNGRRTASMVDASPTCPTCSRDTRVGHHSRQSTSSVSYRDSRQKPRYSVSWQAPSSGHRETGEFVHGTIEAGQRVGQVLRSGICYRDNRCWQTSRPAAIQSAINVTKSTSAPHCRARIAVAAIEGE